MCSNRKWLELFTLGALILFGLLGQPQGVKAQTPSCEQIQAIIDQIEANITQLAEDPNCEGSARTICMSEKRSLEKDPVFQRARLNTCDKGTPPLQSGAIYPSYYVLTILYAPPGNQSEVKYSTGSTTGSRTEITTKTQGGFAFQMTSTYVELDVGYSIGNAGGNSVEVKKETRFF